MSEPTSRRQPLTTKDRLRRTAIGLFVILCLAIIVIGATRSREIDQAGTPIEEKQDLSQVEISGDRELVESQPPGAHADDGSGPTYVEQIFPADPTAEILSQQQIYIDLVSPYDVATFTINGTVIPDGELTRRPELNQVFFTPAEDATFSSLPSGRTCATASIVSQLDPTDVLRTVEWCFNVT